MAMGVGLPIKIDLLTISLYHGIFARILVEVDLPKTLTRRILVTPKGPDISNKIIFCRFTL